MSSVAPIAVPEAYDEIRADMLNIRYNAPSAYQIVGRRAYYRPPAESDFSFARQLPEFALAQSAHTQAPDIILLTAISAIPVADSVRAYYHALGQPLPVLSHIDANQKAAFEYSHEDLYGTERKRALEAARLGALGVSGSRVCIIEQFIHKGRVMEFAVALAQQAGYSDISAISGRWYMDADKSPAAVDQYRLTSSHRKFFEEVGHMAAMEQVTRAY